MAYQVNLVKPGTKGAYEPRGADKELIAGDHRWDRELLICSCRDTGKSLACCVKSHLILTKYNGAQGVIVRRELKSMPASILLTYERLLKKEIQADIIQKYGGERVEHYQYANGSRLWVCGMDNADKVLSSEKDFIYVCQAEELKEDDWEKLTTCTTGRSAIYPHSQVFADCNPGGSKHWLRVRCDAGRTTMLQGSHTDNPQIYRQLTEAEFATKFPNGWHRPKEIQERPDPMDDVIEAENRAVVRKDDSVFVLSVEGWRRLRPLVALSGVRRKRLLDGLWASAEGAVYDNWNPDIHRTARDRAEFRNWMMYIDEGYTNPCVIGLVGEDGDRRLHQYRAFYQRGVLQSEVVKRARDWAMEFNVTLLAVDESAAGLIADLRNAMPGIVRVVGAKGRVLDGIQAIQNMLNVAGDGKPRLTIDTDSSNDETQNEFESYEWKPERDEPKKEYDHSLDGLRYLIDALYGDNLGASASDWCNIIAAEIAGKETRVIPGQPLQREPTEKSQKAIACVYHGHPVNCTAKDYHTEIRASLQAQAAKWVEEKQDVRAVIALEEVRRLDALYPVDAPPPDEELSWAGSYH